MSGPFSVASSLVLGAWALRGWGLPACWQLFPDGWGRHVACRCLVPGNWEGGTRAGGAVLRKA